DVDSIVKAGMSGLTLFLAQRTALEAGDPVGVDPASDDLAFFPLIYWPVVPGAPKPPQDAINRIDAYMMQGGTVVFDTRDAIEAPPGENGASQTPGMQSLREILSSLDVPELEPVPREREFAFRAGVHIVMCTLTENYKTDLVHAPALIERLGQ